VSPQRNQPVLMQAMLPLERKDPESYAAGGRRPVLHGRR
jgi:hypothetical protein